MFENADDGLFTSNAHLMNCHVLWDSDASPIQIYRDHIQQIRCRGTTEKCLLFNKTKVISSYAQNSVPDP